MDLRWDAQAGHYTFADGSTLPVVPTIFYEHLLWSPTLAGLAPKISIERESPDRVMIDLEISFGKGGVPSSSVIKAFCPDRPDLVLGIIGQGRVERHAKDADLPEEVLAKLREFDRDLHSERCQSGAARYAGGVDLRFGRV